MEGVFPAEATTPLEWARRYRAEAVEEVLLARGEQASEDRMWDMLDMLTYPILYNSGTAVGSPANQGSWAALGDKASAGQRCNYPRGRLSTGTHFPFPAMLLFVPSPRKSGLKIERTKSRANAPLGAGCSPTCWSSAARDLPWASQGQIRSTLARHIRHYINLGALAL